MQKVVLFDHQREAVSKWLANGGKGILSMATGTGKTYAALGCLEELAKKESPLVVVITFPWNHLLLQWESSLQKFNLDLESVIVVGRERNWRKVLKETFIDVELGYKRKIAILVSHALFSSEFFCEQINRVSKVAVCCLIGDEVHGLGAPQRRIGLLDAYRYRLGLSATPKRYFDDEGTEFLLNYFGGVVFEFSLKDAVSTLNPITLETYLTPYNYFLKFVSLQKEEVEEYIRLTSEIARRLSNNKDKEEEGRGEENKRLLEQLLFRRAKIVKSAKNKIKALEEIVEEIGPRNLKYVLVYCNEELLESVINFFNEKGILSHRFTMKESSNPSRKFGGLSEREFYLKAFGEGVYQALVAIKCLDEGIDIPPAQRAVLMTSSGNPREFIQRLGRVLRRYLGKKRAQVYDMVVYVPMEFLPVYFLRIEQSILEREFKRCEAIAECAGNWCEVTKEIFLKRKELLEVSHFYKINGGDLVSGYD